jgi:4-alpha-glucanotransferase
VSVREHERGALERLAAARGVETSYLDVDGKRHQASDETLIAVLAALGEPLSRPSDAVAAVAELARARRRQPAFSPVIAWDGRLRLRRSRKELEPPRLWLRAEAGGDARQLCFRIDPDGHAQLVEPLELGVHELVDSRGSRRLCIAAPARAPGLSSTRPVRLFGVFAPTYALMDDEDRRAGDLGDLERLGKMVAEKGARLLATLPLLAEVCEADGGPSGQHPYAPLSRLWWNEGYLDLARLPELAGAQGAALIAEARAKARSTRVARSGADGRRLADVSSAAAAARPALEAAAMGLQASGGPRRAAYEAFVTAHPDLERYARFRAAIEVAGVDPSRWPARWRSGRIEPAEVPKAAVARHCYAQFATDAQLEEVDRSLAKAGCGLLLDLPVGCQGGGYDPWAYPEAFASQASVGAPPDDFFTGGQNWGLPPPLPDGDRLKGYRLLRSVLARHMAHARMLRVDHVLGWARLWWVPEGMAPSQGAYVRYPTEELLALACLEAHRAGCALVGEDLGTVPRGLRPRLARHNVAGMRVGVFDLEARPRARLCPPAGSVAYLDTHDTATFAGFLTGADLKLRENLGLKVAGSLPQAEARRRRAVNGLIARLVREGLLAEADRDNNCAILGAVLEELGRSDARLVVVALEDLLGESEPQNVPGTTHEHDNFSRAISARLGEEALEARLAWLLGRLDAARRAGRAPSADTASKAS